MLKITEKLTTALTPSASLTLPFEKRQKSRLRVSLDNNQEAALMLERGSVLRHGELLRADNGLVVEVRAANEEVAVISTEDSFSFGAGMLPLGQPTCSSSNRRRLAAHSKRPCFRRNGSVVGSFCET